MRGCGSLWGCLLYLWISPSIQCASLPAPSACHWHYNAGAARRGRKGGRMAATPGSLRPLSLHTRTESGAIVVECRGRLVREAADQLRQTVKPLISQTNCLILDLTDL